MCQNSNKVQVVIILYEQIREGYNILAMGKKVKVLKNGIGYSGCGY